MKPATAPAGLPPLEGSDHFKAFMRGFESGRVNPYGGTASFILEEGGSSILDATRENGEVILRLDGRPVSREIIEKMLS